MTSQDSNAKLIHFIVYTLHGTKLHSVTFRPLSSLSPCSWIRLFLSTAFMITSKVTFYLNRSQSIVILGMFQLRKMWQYFNWELNDELQGIRSHGS